MQPARVCKRTLSQMIFFFIFLPSSSALRISFPCIQLAPHPKGDCAAETCATSPLLFCLQFLQLCACLFVYLYPLEASSKLSTLTESYRRIYLKNASIIICRRHLLCLIRFQFDKKVQKKYRAKTLPGLNQTSSKNTFKMQTVPGFQATKFNTAHNHYAPNIPQHISLGGECTVLFSLDAALANSVTVISSVVLLQCLNL